MYVENDLCNKHDWTRCKGFEKKQNKNKTTHSFAEIGDCHEPKEVCCVFHVLCGCFWPFFLFQKNICLNKLVHTFWLPVSSSHLISVPPNWQRHATKTVRSFIPCHFIIFGERSDPPRNLRVPDFRVISVPDLALADRAIYRPRGLKTHKGRHKTRAIKVIWSFIHILKRMWGFPVKQFEWGRLVLNGALDRTSWPPNWKLISSFCY